MSNKTDTTLQSKRTIDYPFVLKKVPRVILLLFLDLITIAFAIILSVSFRPSVHNIETLLIFAADQYEFYIAISAIIVLLFGIFKLYTVSWRYASFKEYLLLYFSVVVSFSLVLLVMSLFYNSAYFFRNPIYYILCMMFTVCGVTATRLILVSLLMTNPFSFVSKDDSGSKILIIGAGDTGVALLRSVIHDGHNRVVAFIDDAHEKQGLKINNIPVVGDRYSITDVAKEYKIDEIILAIPSSEEEDYNEIIKICSKTKCKIKTVPSLFELVSGKASVNQLNEVKPIQLLGRKEILIDDNDIFGYIAHKTVIVTGGGGSIGSELCRQIAKFNPKMLIIFDIYENNAYELQYELNSDFPHLDLITLIGSVRDRARLEQVFEEYNPDVVFHAAAHKHVPLMEDSPNEAIKNNVFGTYNVAITAEKFKVSRFVLISTDKAVNPTNIMGTSKRVAEMVIQQLAMRSKEGGTIFTAVRFGNVLGSNGSVISLFKKQIANGGPVTVTHPEINRFFMTIPEAAQLVMQAGALAKGGEIFILDMGEPVKIIDLAKNLIKLSGLRPDVDIKIEYTGLRPGEKMYEEILLDKSKHGATKHNKIYIENPVTDYDSIVKEMIALHENINCDCPIYSTMVDWFEKEFGA